MAWSDLPVDLLLCIANKLSFVDFIRLSVVCTSWNFSLTNNDLRIRGPSSPWLLLPDREFSHTLIFDDLTIKEGAPHCYRHFSSLDSHVSGNRCFGSKDGWLVILNKIDMQPRLFNPLTKVEKFFPSLLTIPEDEWHRIKPRYAPDGSIKSYYNEIYPRQEQLARRFCDVYFHKIVISSNDPLGTAVVIYGYFKLLALARPYDQTWVLGPQIYSDHTNDFSQFEDVYYHEEERKFYAITCSSAVLVFDLNGQNVKLVCPPQCLLVPYDILNRYTKCRKYVTFLSGTLLKIERNISYMESSENALCRDIRISVYKLTSNVACSSLSEWISIKDLEGWSLFVGTNNAFSLHHTIVPEIRPNCIYFSDETHYMPRDELVQDAGIFHLRNGRFQNFFNFCSSPTLTPSIWFTPSLF